MQRLTLTLLSLLCLCASYVTSQRLSASERAEFESYNVTIVEDPSNSSQWIFSHTGIPHHDVPASWGDNPSSISVRNHMYEIPKVPVVADTPDCLRLGIIAVAINGIPYYNDYSAEGENAVLVEQLDSCSGHPQMDGEYHYHSGTECISSHLEDQLVGVALDGYPIYSKLTAYNGDLRNLTNAELDPCNGWERDGAYEYRLTNDFPYVLGCYHGISTAMTLAKKRKKRQQPGGMPPPGGAGGSDSSDPYEWNAMTSCIYATYCETPGDGCQCAAYTYLPDAPRTNGQDTCTDSGSHADSLRTAGLGLLLHVSLVIYLFHHFWDDTSAFKCNVKG